MAHPFYRRLGQAYLTVERAIGDAVEDADIDWSTRERARFAAGILASGLAPTNTLVGNPTALKHAFDTGGASLVRGGRNLLGDLRHTRMPRQVDASPFTRRRERRRDARRGRVPQRGPGDHPVHAHHADGAQPCRC